MNCRICGGYVTANSCVICGSFINAEMSPEILQAAWNQGYLSTSASNSHDQYLKSMAIARAVKSLPIKPSQIHDEVMISDECDRCEALANSVGHQQPQLYSPPPPPPPPLQRICSVCGKEIPANRIAHSICSSNSSSSIVMGDVCHPTAYTLEELILRDRWNRHEDRVKTVFTLHQRELISAQWSKRLRESIAKAEELERNKVTIDNSFYDDYEY